MDQRLLLLVVAALVAGLAAWAWERHRRRHEATRAYLKGVRSIISDDPDAAIEALSDAARLGTPQALETYLALGELFRRTGDLARAIRLHKNMLVGPGLPDAARPEVQRALAEDLRRSGMLVEAAELLEAQTGERAAQELLRDVRADQGAWREAARLQAGLAGAGPDRLRAHLLAAAARADLAQHPPQRLTARESALAAVEADPDLAAAHLALAEAEAAMGDSPAALASLAQGLELDPRAAVLAWPALLRCADASAALAFVEARVARAPRDPALRMLLGRQLHRAGRRAEALEAFRAALEADESGEVTLALRDLLREAAEPDPEADDLPQRHQLVVAALQRRVRSIRCAGCGAEAASRSWRCGHCGAFDPFDGVS